MGSTFNDFIIRDLGERAIPSPVNVSYYTPDSKRILYNIYIEHYRDMITADGVPLSLEVAGPREKIFLILHKRRRPLSPVAASAPASMTLSGRFSWNCFTVTE
jgi:hypothetical protein